jgi:hypothetical protein
MKNHLAKIVGMLFLFFSAFSHALIVVEDNWLEIISDVYAFNSDNTEIISHGAWSYTGGATNKSHSASIDNPHAELLNTLSNAFVSEEFFVGICPPRVVVHPTLTETLFSGVVWSDDISNFNLASSFLRTNWRFTTTLKKTSFEIKMIAENIPNETNISYAIIDNLTNVVLYQEHGSGTGETFLNSTGILPPGDYTLIVEVDRSDQPLETNSSGDGMTHFYFAVSDKIEMSSDLTHTPVPMPIRLRPIGQPTKIEF